MPNLHSNKQQNRKINPSINHIENENRLKQNCVKTRIPRFSPSSGGSGINSEEDMSNGNSLLLSVQKNDQSVRYKVIILSI